MIESILLQVGHVAEWLRRGLQILPSQFDSGRGLQNLQLFCSEKKVSCYNSSVAQLVEQLTVNQLVAGSSPARGANLIYPVFSIIFVLPNTCNILSFCASEKF